MELQQFVGNYSNDVCKQGGNLRELWNVGSPLTVQNCHFVGQKWQYSVFLQCNLLDPGLVAENIPR